MNFDFPDANSDHSPQSDSAQRKQQLRATIRGDRRALSSAIKADKDSLIASHAVEYLRTHDISVATAFVPMRFEPGGAELPFALANEVQHLLLPRIATANDGPPLMDFCAFDPRTEQLVPGPMGILEPPGPAFSGFPAGIDLFFIPALAVDSTGARLGQGGGYYDTNLAELAPDAEVCAIVYAHEHLDHVPTEPWDLRVTSVLTEDGFKRLQV